MVKSKLGRLNAYEVVGYTRRGNCILDEFGADDASIATALFIKHYPDVEIAEVNLVGRGINLGFLGAYCYKRYSDEELLRLGCI